MLTEGVQWNFTLMLLKKLLEAIVIFSTVKRFTRWLLRSRSEESARWRPMGAVVDAMAWISRVAGARFIIQE